MRAARGRLRTQAIVLIGVAALAPIAVLGALAIAQARAALHRLVLDGNADTARRATAEIALHIDKNAAILRRLVHVLAPQLRLDAEQVHAILKSYRIDTPAFRELSWVGADGHEIATSRADAALRDRSGEEAVRAALGGSDYRLRVHISSEKTPEITLAVAQRAAGRVVGALVATVDITEMWTVVDGIRLGGSGYARVVGEDGVLIAGGTGELKRRVFSGERDASTGFVARVLSGERGVATTYRDAAGEELFAVGQPVSDLGWVLVLEQPVAEALAPIRRFTAITAAMAAALLLAAAIAGALGARTVVRPIEALRRRADEIGGGALEGQVEVDGADELRALATSMNGMSTELVRLHEDVRRKERIATLGRLAAGLAHDLKHPIRALQVNAQLITERPDDPMVRRNFRDVVQREFRRLERFLDDLRRVSRDEPIAIQRAPFDVGDALQSFAREQRESAPSGIEIRVEDRTAGAFILGSRELVERVLANLASNAYEAMQGEGVLSLSLDADDGAVVISVGDTGAGIEPERIDGLFNDFSTTKRRGLGLGLAVCRKIVVDHGGQIDVRSVVGEGTTFRVRLPRAPGPLGLSRTAALTSELGALAPAAGEKSPSSTRSAS